MSTQPPDTPQPPPSLWGAIPEIVKKLQNEFLLASIAYLLLVVASDCASRRPHLRLQNPLVVQGMSLWH
jgi:hypothetical protein